LYNSGIIISNNILWNVWIPDDAACDVVEGDERRNAFKYTQDARGGGQLGVCWSERRFKI